MDKQQFKKCDKCKDHDAVAIEHGTRYLCAECWLDWSRGGAK